MHARDGLSIDRIAPMLGIHRATAARRLERARADALDAARAILQEGGLSASEARSLCIALAPEVDVSIARALADDGVP
jgi:RNA polymerase sigma-70 factor (ECF subfamily)